MADATAQSLTITCNETTTLPSDIKIFSTNKPAHDEIDRPYNLRNMNCKIKINSCLNKQLQATFRDNLRIVETGGGLRLFMSTGHYHEFRRVTTVYYKHLKKHNEMNLEFQDLADANNIPYTTIIRASISKRLASWRYTVNLYHTTLSALVNGSHEEVFYNEHLPEILALMDSQRVENLNKNVQNCLMSNAPVTTLKVPDTQVKVPDTQVNTPITVPETKDYNLSIDNTTTSTIGTGPEQETCMYSETELDTGTSYLSPSPTLEKTPTFIIPQDASPSRKLNLSSSKPKIISSKLVNKLSKSKSSSTCKCNSPDKEITNLHLVIKNLEASALKLNDQLAMQCEKYKLLQTVNQSLTLQVAEGDKENKELSTKIISLTAKCDKSNEENKQLMSTISLLHKEIECQDAKVTEQNKMLISLQEQLHLLELRLLPNKPDVLNTSYTSTATNTELVTPSQSNIPSTSTARTVQQPTGKIQTRQERLDAIRVTQPNKNLIFGSSLVKGLNSRRLDNKNNTSVRTLSGANIKDMSTYIERCPSSSRVENIIYLIGSNNVSAHMDLVQCECDLINLINITKHKFPKSKIQFIELLPRNYKSFNVYVRGLRSMMANTCQRLNCILIKTLNQFIYNDSSVKRYLYDDLTHLNNKGTATLARVIKHALNLPIWNNTLYGSEVSKLPTPYQTFQFPDVRHPPPLLSLPMPPLPFHFTT
ncbi:hypothetical protein SNE40_002777 [Patella caerulea]|uniref:Uncharacterized protein n=2 Tax=Patella caerulea TaxID=87958 RepID=A0AAN8Q7U6_PATCE